MEIYPMEKVQLFQEGKGPQVLFLHGWGQTHHSMQPLIHLLSPSFTCLSIDLPGFGTSPEPAADWTIADYREWIETVIQMHHLHIQAVVGHSFGGKIAVDYALHHPLQGLVLIASSTLRPKTKWLTKLKILIYKGLRLFFPLIPPQQLKSIFGSRDYQKSSTRMQKILIQAVHTYYDQQLELIHGPTLVMWGKKDLETPVYLFFRHRQKLTQCETYLHPTGDHFAFQQEPHLFAYHIQRFLRKVGLV